MLFRTLKSLPLLKSQRDLRNFKLKFNNYFGHEDRQRQTMEQRIENLKKQVKSYEDFPKAGILFRDCFSLLQDPTTSEELKNVMIEYVTKNIPAFDVVVGLESRGFIFGTLVASAFQLPFVPIRKPGKLPGELVSYKYQLEYGSDTFEMQKDAIKEDQKVLIVDDLIATGGSLVAASNLIEMVGGKVTASFLVMELSDLQGREKVNHPIHSLIKF